MDCSEVLKDVIAAKCDDGAIAGTYGEVILMGYGDIDRASSVETENVISKIIPKAGKKGAKFSTFDDAVLGAISLSKGTYVSSWQHDLTLRVLIKREAVKSFVNNIKNSTLVAIVKNKELGESGEVQYEVYGWDAGLKLNEVTATTEVAEGVVYELVLGSGEASKEKTLPKSVFDTDLATTETMLATLVSI